jgi:hypothetical protein
MAGKNAELIKNIMINLGILLVLVSTCASRDLNVTYFFLGLILLALHTLDFKGTEPKRLVTAEIILAGSLSVAGVVQLIMSKSFGASQVFLILLLLGGLLITIESVRKYADL